MNPNLAKSVIIFRFLSFNHLFFGYLRVNGEVVCDFSCKQLSLGTQMRTHSPCFGINFETRNGMCFNLLFFTFSLKEDLKSSFSVLWPYENLSYTNNLEHFSTTMRCVGFKVRSIVLLVPNHVDELLRP